MKCCLWQVHNYIFIVANDADGKYLEDFIDVFSKDVVTSVQFTESSMDAEHSKLAFENTEEAEYQCNNLLSQPAISCALIETGDVESSQSWTGCCLKL